MSQNDSAVSGKVPAFFFWLLPIPLATLWTLWKLTQPNMNNAGYVMPALSIAVVLGVFIAALVTGLLTRTAGASLLGALASVPVAFAVGSITLSQAQTQPDTQPEAQAQSRPGPKYTEMTNMLPVLLGANKEAIAHAIRHRKSFTVPWMMCVLALDVQGVDGKVFGASGKQAVSMQGLLQVAEAVVALDLPLEVKQSSLTLAFQGMVRRDALSYLPAWAKLWDQAHGSKNGKTIAFGYLPNLEDDRCNWSSTRELAVDLVSTWGDEGINAWIATGHTFVEEQRKVVLHGAKQPATLENIVGSGVTYGPPYLPLNGPGSNDHPLLSSYVEMLQSTVLRDDPQRAVKLLATYQKLVRPTPEGRAEMRAACKRFHAAAPAADAHSQLHWQAAVKAFQQRLCTAQ